MNSLDFQIIGKYNRVMETKKGILLFNHYHDKQRIQPIPFESINFSRITISKELLFIKSFHALDTSYNSYFRHGSILLVTDPYEEGQYYIVVGHQQADSKTSIYCFSEKNNKINIIFETNIDSHQIHEIVNITKDYLYVTTRYSSDNIYLYRINKTNGDKSQVYYTSSNANRGDFYLINDDEHYIYLMNRYNYDNFNFYRFNKTTASMTVKNVNYSNTDTKIIMAGTSWIFDNFYRKDNIVYIYYPYYHDKEHLGMSCLPFDTNLDVTQNVYERFEAVQTDSLWRYIPNGSDSDATNIFRFWVVDDRLFMFVYDDYYSENKFASIESQRLHTFKILEDGKLEYISENQIDTKNQVISICFSSDKKVINVGFHNCFKLMKYNETTKEYELTSDRFILDVSSTGFDEYDRVWVQHIDDSVDVYSLNDPYSAFMKFEKPAYIYINENIESYIAFEAFDFSGGPAKGKYIFELSGPVIFSENGKQKIEINYESNVLKLPITVNGADQLSCKVYFTKESE